MTNYPTNLDRVFQALSDPTRRAIVQRLSRGAATVSELSRPFAMALPTLLQHLRILEESGLIGTEKIGRVRTCEMRSMAFGVAQAWMAAQRGIWEARLDRMEAYVSTLETKEKKRGDRKRTKR
jgi:DNA-binding transcriptional ArsR family regulator